MNSIAEVKKLIKHLVTEKLRINESELDEYDNLVEIGVDSLLMVDINSALKKNFGVTLQISKFFGGINTITDIAQYVYENAGEISAPKEEVVQEQLLDVNTMVAATTESYRYNIVPPQMAVPNNDFRENIIRQFADIVNQLLYGINSNPHAKNEPIPNNASVKNDFHKSGESSNNKASEYTQEKDKKEKRKDYVPYTKIDLSRKERAQSVKMAINKLTKEYNEKTKSSKQYAQKIRMGHADWRNVTRFRIDLKELCYQLVTKDCNGSKIIDIDGNEYIDLAMGFGVNLFGHKPKFILDAITEEMQHGFPLSMISKSIEEVSDLICEMTGMERVAYFNSGSEAVMIAVRVARAKTLKHKIVYFAGAYHGDFDGVLGIPGDRYENTLPIAVGILPNMVNDLIILRYGDRGALKIIEENADDIAGVLVEPVQSRNPSLQPREFVKELRKLTKEKDIALIFDEMITGFRISAGGAQEFYGVKADIATYGKIVGGGMPIGVVAGISDYMDCLDGGMWQFGDNSFPPNEEHRTMSGGTFCHHPLSMAAAKVVLTKIKNEKEFIYPELNRRTQRLADELNKFFDEECVPIKVTYFGSLFRFETSANMEIFYYYMLMEGLYIWEGRNCFLSFAHSDEDIDIIIDRIKKVTMTMKGVFFEDKKRKSSDQYSLISQQQAAMLTQMVMQDDASQFHENIMIKVYSNFNEEVFESSVQKVIGRHDSLHTVLDEDGIHLKKINYIDGKFKINRCIFENEITEDDIKSLTGNPIDIYNEFPIRVYSIQSGIEKYVLFVVHHLFVDGYSIVLFLSEVLSYYNASMDSSNSLSLKPVMNLEEYETRKREVISNLPKEEINNFWKDYLDGAISLELPQMSLEHGNVGKRLNSKIDKVQYLDIKMAASKYNCTPFTLMLSAAQILLSKVCGQNRFTIGTPFAGQLLFNDKATIGSVDKIIPVVSNVFPEITAVDVIKEDMNFFDNLVNYSYMFEEVCEKDVTSLTPNMNVIFNLDSAPKLSILGDEIKFCSIPINKVMYDLMINLTLFDNEIVIEFDYNSNRYSDKQVKSWLNGYLEILNELINSENPYISKIKCVNLEDEKILTSSVKDVVYNCDKFIDEIKKYSISSFSYVVLDSYRNLLPIGSIGNIALYANDGCLYVTQWYGKVNSDYMLELIDKRGNILLSNGKFISKRLIENTLKLIDVISSVNVLFADNKQIIAEIESKQPGDLSLDFLTKHCRSKLPAYMCPTQFYICKQDTKVLLEQGQLRGLEKEIQDICKSIIDCSNIGQNDNLIHLGMSSIQIIDLFSQLQEKYGVRPGFSTRGYDFTIASIADEIHKYKNESKINAGKIEPLDKQDYYETSFAQKRLFIEYQINKDSVAYNIPTILYIKGQFDGLIFKEALNTIIQRHEILRTYFAQINGEIVQIISEQASFEFDVLSTDLPEGIDKYLKLQMKEFVKPFVLEKLPLIRVKIIKYSEEKSVVLFDIHHIIFDGFSEIIFFNELLALLNRKDLPELKVQYKDFAAWQNELLKSDAVSYQEEYWKNKFEHGIPVLNLFHDFNDLVAADSEGEDFNFEINKELSDLVNKFCTEINCTPFVFFLSIFSYVIKLYSDNEEVVFSITLEGRNQYQLQNMMGFFVNNLPILVQFGGFDSIKSYVEYVKNNFYEVMDNSDIQLDRIFELCGIERSSKRHSVFDVNFVYQDFEDDHKHYVDDTEITSSQYRLPECMFDLDFEIVNQNDTYEVNIKYTKDLFLQDTIKRISVYFIQCIKQFVDNYDETMESIEVVDSEERELILNTFNDTYAEYPKDITIVELFEEQANRTPENIAVVYGDKHLTYSQLNARANSLANKLRELGVKPGDFIAVISNRSIEMYSGIYGIIKSGAAYVPVDPKYPKERIEYILNDCKPKVVLTYNSEVEFNGTVIDLGKHTLWGENADNPILVNTADDPIYVIYTSGTTGKPKGVVNMHKGTVNRILWMQNQYPIGEKDVILQKTTYTFDVSVWEIFWWGLVGAKVCALQQGDEKDAEKICNEVAKNKITTIHFVPTMLQSFLEYLQDNKKEEERLRSLKYIFASGEALKPAMVEGFLREIKASNERARLINLYGPTEASIDVTYYECNKVEKVIPIGKPIHNMKLYILDGNALCGIGVPGELCIAGIGVAREYLNRPELTAEKFIPNPFGEGKIYRTGDLARWLTDGNIEYLGRIDNQVKIRGFRIELGEIESVIRKAALTKACAVISRENETDQYLCAYIVSDEKVDVKKLKEKLLEELPEYMVPSYFMQIDALPSTINGKLDKKSLPDIVVESKNEYIEPRNELEKNLCQLFAEILGAEHISIEDNFFDLGGHSLKATKLVNLINYRTGYRVTLKDIFTYPTVEQLARNLSVENTFNHIPKAVEKTYYSMSSTQKRIYCIQELEGKTSYNMSQLLKICGNVNINKIKFAFTEMIQRHEILRTRLFMLNGEFIQQVMDDYLLDFEYTNNMEAPIEEIYTNFVRPFNLQSGNVIRMKIVEGVDCIFMMVDMHHVVSDAISVDIFVKEFCDLYNDNSLPLLSLQYKDYSEWFSKKDLSVYKEFWLNQLEDAPVLNMPLDFERTKEQSYMGAVIEHEVSHDIVQLIDKLSRKTSTTEYMILLSALMVTLSQYSMQKDIIVGTPISGRTNEDMEQIMGMFVNSLPMRGRLDPNKTYLQFLNEIKEFALKAYENQEYPFEAMVEDLGIIREMSRNPIFDVMLTMNHTENVKMKLNGAEVSYIDFNQSETKLDLSFSVTEKNGITFIALEYCTDLFTAETANRILAHYIQTIKVLLLNNEKLLGDIEIVNEDEKQLIINEFNHTDREYPKDKTIVELFEEQVEKQPEYTAVTFKDREIDYSELNAKANILARRLREIGVGPDDFVAIIADRSIEMIIGILGVLKSGGAYVPIDPLHPSERIDFILDDCKPKAILTYQKEVGTSMPIINLGEEEQWWGDTSNVIGINKPSDLAYCIYTSGTTGKPKGVMIEHKSLINYIVYAGKTYIDKNPIIPFFTNYCFDLTVTSIFASLLYGGTLVCFGEDQPVTDILAVTDYNMIKLTPIHLKMLLECKEPYSMKKVKSFILGGEALEIETSKQALQKFGMNIEIHNEYGPTEATIGCCDYIYDIKDAGRFVSIGKPIDNVQIYILNKKQLCGIGIPGELCIAGDGVARGYLNRPELTAEKFIPNPFGEGKLYRTGDLARWLSDGKLEFLGRIDDQVKIRGFRIELGEIESVIRKAALIKDCAVISREKETDQYLCAYIVSDEKVDVKQLKDKLLEELPEYMVPSYFMQIDALPATRNGKVDKKSLPDIAAESDEEYVAPRDEKEFLIQKIFEEILYVDQIGIMDNFFALGGDSIKALRIVSKIRESCYNVAVKDIMQERTIEKIAAVLQPITENVEYEQGEVAGSIEYTPIQKQFFNNNYAETNYYNQSVIFTFKERVNEESLKESLYAIVAHHDILRAVYRDGKQEVLPIQGSKMFDLYFNKFEQQENLAEIIEEECNKIQSSFNLETGPLFKIGVFRTDESDTVLLCIHHLVVDGVSWRILMEDFVKVYKQVLNKEKVVLPSKTASYGEWSKLLKEYEMSNFAKKESDYWNTIYSKTIEGRLSIHKKKGRGVYKKASVSWNKDYTQKLLFDVNKSYGTEINDILFSALGIAINKLTGQKMASVALEGHGREELHRRLDVDRTVGWFTSMYPIALEVKDDIASTIMEMKEMIRRIPNGGLGFGLMLKENIQADILFNYLGNYDLDLGFEANNSLLIKSKYSSGNDSSAKNKQEFPIVLNGSIINGELRFDISYEDCFMKKDIIQLSKYYKEALIEIINHCCSKDTVAMTGSDFGENNISTDDMQALEGLLDLL